MRGRHWIFLALAAVLTIGAGGIVRGDWPMAGANPQRTSWCTEEIRGELKPQWFAYLEPHIGQKVQIIAALDTLYVSTAGGLYALDPQDGRTRWVYRTDLPLAHSPTIADGVAYVGGFDDSLHAVDARSGQGLWTFRGGAGFQTSPLAVEGLVIAGCRDGVLYAVDPRTGQEAWRFTTGGPITYSAAYADGAVYFASCDDHAYAVRASDGQLLWKSEKLPGSGFRSFWPVVAGEHVVFAGTHNYRKGIRPGQLPGAIGGMFSIDRLILPASTPWGDKIGLTGMRGPIIGQRLEDGRIDVTSMVDYYTQRPHIRTLFILDRRTGRQSAVAPALWAADDGACNRYPPLVGPDGMLYFNNKLMWNPHWMRGHIQGWQIGSNFIWTPSSFHKAGDEPMAWAGGGNVVYWNHCMLRSAGGFDIARPNPWHFEKVDPLADQATRAAIADREWLYFDHGRILNQPDVQPRLWPFAYGLHGDQNPPIPYKGRLYWHLENGVVCFGPDGAWPEDVNPVKPAPVPPAPKLSLGAEGKVDRKIVGLLTHLKVGTRANQPAVSLLQQRSYTGGNPQPATYFESLAVSAGSSDRGVTQETAQAPGGGGAVLVQAGQDRLLSVRVVPHSPAVLCESPQPSVSLRARFAGVAAPAKQGVRVMSGAGELNGADLTGGWLLAWYGIENHPLMSVSRELGSYARRGMPLPQWTPTPWVISLERRPTQVTLGADALELSFDGPAGRIVLTPLLGLQGMDPRQIAAWRDGLPAEIAARAAGLDRVAKAWPEALTTQWTVDGTTGDVTAASRTRFVEIADAWGTPPLQLALVPHELALAAWGQSPIRFDAPLTDLDYPLPLGRWVGAEGRQSVLAVLPGLAKLWRDDPPVPAEPAAEDPLAAELASQVRKMLDAGHLLPGWFSSGQGDNQWHQFAMGDYFANPAETVVTLLRALPLLPEPMREPVRQYIRQEVAKYPPWSISHVGWAEGVHRTDHTIPPEQDADMANVPASAWSGWGVPPQNLYATWQYARAFGGAAEVAAKASAIARERPMNHAGPYMLNLSVAGHLGAWRLGALAGAGESSLAGIERRLCELLVRRAALSRSPIYLERMGFACGSPQWTVNRYLPEQGEIIFAMTLMGVNWEHPAHVHGRYLFTIDFVGLTPETARFLADYARDAVAVQVADYEYRAPYWFVPFIEEFAGEGTIVPLYDVIALFQAKAGALGASREELERYLDIPALPRGDLFYIQNLCATLEAGPLAAEQENRGVGEP